MPKQITRIQSSNLYLQRAPEITEAARRHYLLRFLISLLYICILCIFSHISPSGALSFNSFILPSNFVSLFLAHYFYYLPYPIIFAITERVGGLGVKGDINRTLKLIIRRRVQGMARWRTERKIGTFLFMQQTLLWDYPSSPLLFIIFHNMHRDNEISNYAITG